MTHNYLSLSQILNNLAAGQPPSAIEQQQLVTKALTPSAQAQAFGIMPENVEERIDARSHLFQKVCHNILSLPFFNSTTQAATLVCLWNLWLPLSMQLASIRQQLRRPLIQGILGGQGTGKTTLAVVLKLILAQLGYRTLGFSLDDLYKTYEERQRLQAEDSRLIWRGPPGTHDVELGLQVLDFLRSPHPQDAILVPRFDKSAWGGAGDRTTPEQVENVDIVLFEGWFAGVRSVDPSVFNAQTPEPIQTDADRTFARDMNERLKDYLPLWERLDRLMVLYPSDYRLSLQWRRQAEQQMIAKGKPGMTDSQINDFVKYFWKALHPQLFITPLTQNPDWVDLVIEINPDHTPGIVYQPSAISCHASNAN
ncbi:MULTISPECIES: glycerate kinase [unclassified Coleofasciculus]|uniref:glycerate kinase n=1 Tax=unclassified Coleofasciculus TaxID=2692782 RepID=UPI00187F26EF|nr:MULTISPECIES: glycerate kinase [unclassified Coleofasciculus]MBE9130199.1 glycerate kinase [Coleofasciculus sp. LEGE 07081]MBE9152420.1 glycerate kinase [Coleofasciculus sp. LEGE 07092]